VSTNIVLTEKLFHTQINLCMELLHKYVETESEDKEGKSSLTSLFLRALLKLYIIIQQNPTLKVNFAYQDFLQSSAPLVARMQDHIIRFQMGIGNLLPNDPYYDPWPEVCWRRSAYQAFLETYQFTLGTDIQEKYIDLSMEDFDPEDIDDWVEGYIMRDGGTVDEDKVPVGIPRSHWWWWGEKTEAA
jgi:hypothetical protein